jgi:hypothetical protein
LIIKVIIAFAGLIVIRIVAGLTTHYLGRCVRDSQSRYRTRTIATLDVYLMVVLFLGIVFKDCMGGLTKEDSYLHNLFARAYICCDLGIMAASALG